MWKISLNLVHKVLVFPPYMFFIKSSSFYLFVKYLNQDVVCEWEALISLTLIENASINILTYTNCCVLFEMYTFKTGHSQHKITKQALGL